MWEGKETESGQEDDQEDGEEGERGGQDDEEERDPRRRWREEERRNIATWDLSWVDVAPDSGNAISETTDGLRKTQRQGKKEDFEIANRIVAPWGVLVSDALLFERELQDEVHALGNVFDIQMFKDLNMYSS